VELNGLVCVGSMAVGLGATPEEWEELKGNVDDSFWVMRIIGYPPLPNDHNGISCGEHKSVSVFHLLNDNGLTTLYSQRLRLFDVRPISVLSLRSKGGLGSSGQMTRRVPYRCSSSNPDCSSRRLLRMEVPLMRPLNRVLGLTPIR